MNSLIRVMPVIRVMLIFFKRDKNYQKFANLVCISSNDLKAPFNDMLLVFKTIPPTHELVILTKFHDWQKL